MAPRSTIILCRHAQAEHNVDLDYSIPDAPLTRLGKMQSATLPAQIADLQKEVDLICSSPLKRTLQTTRIGWKPVLDRLGIKNCITVPQAQECNGFPCDTGSSREELEALDEFKDFDFASLTDDWTSKKGFYAPDPESIRNRTRWVRHFLRDRPENNIVLVAHGDFLRNITADAQGPSEYGWKNAEVKIFHFDAETLDHEAFLVHDENRVATGGYAPTSTEMDVEGVDKGAF
ncbi:phosphoglycerate mutase-like protein [Amniculicola lignicola CBS 123094]|uniref:Phosphoglycerate mutase-like protein n=1 Tax=Amniculicola lignicola CBS 123094 TaxID=1392246 RepID=A0A6A5W990_9PLEO|nr:phosphoglycerate mutase-like protein [Amniculicola lignicola CBS 123094]